MALKHLNSLNLAFVKHATRVNKWAKDTNARRGSELFMTLDTGGAADSTAAGSTNTATNDSAAPTNTTNSTTTSLIGNANVRFSATCGWVVGVGQSFAVVVVPTSKETKVRSWSFAGCEGIGIVGLQGNTCHGEEENKQIPEIGISGGGRWAPEPLTKQINHFKYAKYTTIDTKQSKLAGTLASCALSHLLN
jgi:hypothetical protein